MCGKSPNACLYMCQFALSAFHAKVWKHTMTSECVGRHTFCLAITCLTMSGQCY